MFKYSVTVTSLALELFSLISVQTLKWAPDLWAADEPAQSGMQSHSSPGTEATMPDGVIGVSLRRDNRAQMFCDDFRRWEFGGIDRASHRRDECRSH